MASAPRAGPVPEPPVSWERRFELLEERCGDVGSADRSVTCSLAGCTFTVAGSAEAQSWLLRPLRHLAGPAEYEAPLEIRIGCGANPQVDALWGAAPDDGGRGTSVVRPRLLMGDGRSLIGGLWPDVGMLGLLHRRRRKALLWIRDVDTIPAADAATLFRSVVAWWLSGSTFVVTHAAAVAGPGGAALLAGAGGSGKSSTATACFEAGLSFLGDDSVLCRAADAEVFSLSGCASLFSGDLTRHHPSLSRTACGSAGGDGKVFVDLSSAGPDRVTTSAPLRAVVRLTIREGGAGLEPASRSRVLTALAPSSLFNVPALDPGALAGMASFIRRLDAYELTLAGDRSEAGRLLRDLLGAAGSP